MAGLYSLVTFPFKVAVAVGSWPVRVVEEVYARLKGLLVGPMPATVQQTVVRKSTTGVRRDGREERVREKGMVRKVPR